MHIETSKCSAEEAGVDLNRNYDFNYQYYNFLTKPFTLKKVNLIYSKGHSNRTMCRLNF